MRASIITGCLMTAFVLVTAPHVASAADLDGEEYAEPPYDEGYNERGYGGERDQPRDYSEAPPPDTYYDDEPGEPRPGSIKDGYPVPMPPPRASAPPPPPRYVERGPGRAERYACLDRWQIRRRLRSEGWTGIRPMGGDGAIVHLRANRFDSSTDFHLRVDRCSGDVIAAHPHRARNYAYRDWRWQQRRW